MKRVVEVHKSGTPCFLCLSLLLSTTVLNDILNCDQVCKNHHQSVVKAEIYFIVQDYSYTQELFMHSVSILANANWSAFWRAFCQPYEVTTAKMMTMKAPIGWLRPAWNCSHC